MTRRFFLTTLGAGMISALHGRPAPHSIRTEAQHLASVYKNFFRDPESAATVGREYLRAYPVEADLGNLVERINAPVRRAEQLRPEELYQRLHRQQLQDYEEGRTVKLRGWILSRSEARLCAIVALTGQE